MNDKSDVSAEGRTYAQLVLGIAGTIKERGLGGGMSRGERAELRRMRGDGVPPESFWRIVEKYEIPETEDGFWKSVTPLMVDHPHNSHLRPGRALAAAGVSAARIERWLRRDREAAIAEAGRILSQLDDGLDWISFTQLLRYWTEPRRMQFARDFFLSPEYRDRQRKLEQKETS